MITINIVPDGDGGDISIDDDTIFICTMVTMTAAAAANTVKLAVDADYEDDRVMTSRRR